MAKGRALPKRRGATQRQAKSMMKAFVIAMDPTAPIDCAALREAGDVIAALLAEHCPIAEKPVRKTKP